MFPASVIKPRSGVVLRIFSRKRKKKPHGFSCLSRLCLPLNDICILNIFVSGSRVAQIPTVANKRAAKSNPSNIIKPRSGVVLRIFSRKRKKKPHGFSCLSRLCLPLNDICILNIFVSGSRVAQIPTVANKRAAKSQNKIGRYLTNFMSINRSNPLF